MKIKTKKSVHKSLLVTLIAAIAFVCALFVYAYFTNGSLLGWQVFSRDSSTTQETPAGTQDFSTPATEEQIRDGQSVKQESIESESDDQRQNQTTSLSITATDQSEPGQSVSIRAFIQKVTNQGTCTLTMSSGSQTITETAPIQALPNGSTCQGFDVPFSRISAGTWTALIEYKNGSDTASDQTSIEVR